MYFLYFVVFVMIGWLEVMNHDRIECVVGAIEEVINLEVVAGGCGEVSIIFYALRESGFDVGKLRFEALERFVADSNAALFATAYHDEGIEFFVALG